MNAKMVNENQIIVDDDLEAGPDPFPGSLIRFCSLLLLLLITSFRSEGKTTSNKEPFESE